MWSREAGITYTITAIRSQTRGNPMEFNLKLGANQQQQGNESAGSGDEGENQMKMAA